VSFVQMHFVNVIYQLVNTYILSYQTIYIRCGFVGASNVWMLMSLELEPNQRLLLFHWTRNF